MNKIKYFFQFILVIFIYFIFIILGAKISSFIGGKLFELIGPLFRSNKIINKIIKKEFANLSQSKLDDLKSSMWNNYGRVLLNIFMKNFKKWKS